MYDYHVANDSLPTQTGSRRSGYDCHGYGNRWQWFYADNVVVRLNENGAPIKAIAYVAHNEQWATFNWVRNDQEKPDYWDAPKRFALPKNVRRK